MSYVEKQSDYSLCLPNIHNAENESSDYYRKDSVYNVYNFYDPDSDQPWYFDHVDKEKCKSILINLKNHDKDCTFLIRREDSNTSNFRIYLM